MFVFTKGLLPSAAEEIATPQAHLENQHSKLKSPLGSRYTPNLAMPTFLSTTASSPPPLSE